MDRNQVQESFGEYVKGLRESIGKSQEEFAELLGFKQSHLSNIESGKVTDLSGVIVRLIGIAELNINYREIFRRAGIYLANDKEDAVIYPVDREALIAAIARDLKELPIEELIKAKAAAELTLKLERNKKGKRT